MGMGDRGGLGRLSSRELGIKLCERADGSSSHRTSVAHGTRAIKSGRRVASPAKTESDIAQNSVCGTTISAPNIVAVASGKELSEVILIDSSVLFKYVHDRQGHNGVVGAVPKGSWQRASSDQIVNFGWVDKELFTEGIADGQTVERLSDSLHFC
jgi:hypothetical protein